MPADTTVWFAADRLGSLRHAPWSSPASSTDLTDWLEDVSAEWWFLLVILVIAFFDSIIPIVPSETTVILGGVAAGAGEQNLLLVIAAGAAGAFLGDNTRLPDRPALQPAASSAAPRAGRRPASAWSGPTTQIRKRGGLLLITARFIPGGRTVLTITSGLTHQPWAWFAGWVAIAAVIWATYAAVPRRHLRHHVRPHPRLPPGVRVGAVGHGDHRGRPPPAGQARRARARDGRPALIRVP